VKAFEYVAADRAGELVSGVAWALDELELDRRLDGRGLVLTAAHVVADEKRARPIRIRHADLILFTTQLATVTSAGVPLLEGLQGIRARARRSEVRRLIAEMISALESGQPLSSVMQAYPRTFPAIYRASVVAGESSGALDTVLVRVAAHMEWARGMRATTVQALIYPAMLAVAMLGLIAVLLFFLLPRILTMFPAGVADLPYQTRVVLGISDFLRAHVLLLGAGLAVAGASLTYSLRTERGRYLRDRFVLALPLMGRVARDIATSKFAATASILHSSGCDVFTVLGVSASACGNRAMERAFERTTARVRAGAQLSQGLELEPLVDPLLIQLVAVGEKTGSLDRSLAKVAEHYDGEVPRNVKRMLSLLEPALLVGAGVVVAFILLAALLPMFQMMENIQ
jgi:type II secretory pathway component PulF